MARTSEVSLTASAKSRVIPAIAVRKRLPKLWSSRPPSLLKRNRKSRDMRCSSSERAIMQFRMSPGGRTCSSSRRRPELPPSSVTVTMTDKSALNFFNPRSRVERPVPPPIETIFGLLVFFVANATYFSAGVTNCLKSGSSLSDSKSLSRAARKRFSGRK